MTEPKTPDGGSAADAAEEIIEVIFEDHYVLAVAAFIAGALLIAGIVYLIGTRMTDAEENTDAAN